MSNDILDSAFQPELPDSFWLGLQQFNQGEFYACHDTLEAIWLESQDVSKNLYQGILQIAVGLYHLSNINWQGAVILLGEGTSRLGRYEPVYAGVDIEHFLDDVLALLATLQRMGPDQAAIAAWQLGLITEPPAELKPELTSSLDLKRPLIRWQSQPG